MTTWTPQAVRRLLALVAGIGFFGWGVYLITQGVSATGSLDIRSAVVSGKVESGSAGLFIVLCATVMIVFSVASSGSEITGAGAGVGTNDDPEAATYRVFYIPPITRRIAWVLGALVLVFVAIGLGIASLPTDDPLKIGGGAGLGVVFLAITVLFVWLLTTLFETE